MVVAESSGDVLSSTKASQQATTEKATFSYHYLRTCRKVDIGSQTKVSSPKLHYLTNLASKEKGSSGKPGVGQVLEKLVGVSARVIEHTIVATDIIQHWNSNARQILIFELLDDRLEIPMLKDSLAIFV